MPALRARGASSGTSERRALLVIGMDGGRVQRRDKPEPEGSRWREDKVLIISSYPPGRARTRQAAHAAGDYTPCDDTRQRRVRHPRTA
jgi:hypothetical protein